jgi:predicted enzyme related to lactoylglutathione lyase
MTNPVGWFEIYVADMVRAKAFYEATFSVTLSRLEAPDGPEMWAFNMSEEGYGASGALVRMPGMEPGGNSVLVYFSCADVAVELARALKAGAQLQQDKMSIGQYGFIALLADTEGNMIGLHSMQ